MEIEKIQTNKFKTNVCSIFLVIPNKIEYTTKLALIPHVLKRGTTRLSNQLEINKELENMYGADIAIELSNAGNYKLIKFYIEVLNDKYSLENETLSKNAIKLLKEIIFNPYTCKNDNGEIGFDKEYVEQEKENLRKVIEARSDNKAAYSLQRCIEETFNGKPFGIYKYGKIEDIEKIDEINLYKYYKKLINESKKYFYISGDIEKLEDSIFKEIENISSNNFEIESEELLKEIEINKVIEKQDIKQGKIVISLSTGNENKNALLFYSTILGGQANSKLFQNVREKASLAYYASSSYLKRQNVIFIKTGIEFDNYDKCIKIIQKQLDDMKKANITDSEFDAAKQFIISSIKLCNESNLDMIDFKFIRKINNDDDNLENYINELNKIKKQDVVKVAQNVKMNTIYFLKGLEDNKK